MARPAGAPAINPDRGAVELCPLRPIILETAASLRRRRARSRLRFFGLIMDLHAILAATPAMLRSILGRAALFGALWWLLSGGDSRAFGLGLAAVALALAASWRLRAPAAGRFSILRLPRFLAFFLFMSVLSGLQVAAMALRPRLDVHPGMFAIDLRLPEPTARVFLANTLSVLPGTLSCGLDGNHLLLHVLDRRQPIERQVRRAEALVAHLFRAELP